MNNIWKDIDLEVWEEIGGRISGQFFPLRFKSPDFSNMYWFSDLVIDEIRRLGDLDR